MTTYQITADGITVTRVVDVSYSNTSNGEVGSATITVANTEGNRALFQPGAKVNVFEEDTSNPGTYDKVWAGEVNGKPSDTSRRNLTLQVEAESKSGALEYISVDRPFIEMSNSEVLREAVDKTRDPEVRNEFIHKGSSLTSWSSNAANFSLTSSPSNIQKFGSDAVYCGIPRASTGTTYAEYSFDPSKVPGRRLFRLETRLLVNNRGGVFDVTVSITDEDGIRFEWNVDTTGISEFKNYELAVEDANVSTGGSPGTLRYEVAANDSKVPEDRAFAIDHAKSVTFRLLDRDVGVTTDIEETEFKTTRRVSTSVLNLLDRFRVEDGYVGRVTSDNTLIYEPDGSTRAPFDVVYGSGDVDVVDISVNRDYDVRNRVTVQGKDDVQVSFEDTASIQFYNAEVPKQEPIDNPSIRTIEQARRRARGYLNENAWEDGAITVTVADPRSKQVEAGQVMGFDWEPEGLDGDFTVDSVSRKSSGLTEISVSGSTSL